VLDVLNFHDYPVVVIQRKHHNAEILHRLDLNPVVAIVGARQVGKTTLAHQIGETRQGKVTRFDLEKPSDLARLADPQLALTPLDGLVILDEIQRLPDIFPVLRVLADRPDTHTRFLLLGSASPQLLRQSSESLAGRISYYELPGLSLDEVAPGATDNLWVRGGFPRSFLAPDDEASDLWRQDFILTYLERDLPGLGINLPANLLRRFWTMLAHSHGQLWNGSRIGGALGVAHTTARSYLDVLHDTFMVRLLQPYLANTGKRQVKSPKVYLRDTGLLHALLGIRNHTELTGHPVMGFSWESYAMEQVIRSLGVDERRCYCWAVHTGAEIDLVVEDGRQLLGFEFKRTLAPKTTRSMRSAIETLGLAELTVVYPGREAYPLAETITVRPLESFCSD
jgi:uncharacterized protein